MKLLQLLEDRSTAMTVILTQKCFVVAPAWVEVSLHDGETVKSTGGLIQCVIRTTTQKADAVKTKIKEAGIIEGKSVPKAIIKAAEAKWAGKEVEVHSVEFRVPRVTLELPNVKNPAALRQADF